jgi:phosphoserine phosphatase RsbU/P
MSKKGISFRLNTNITSLAILIIASIVYVNYYFSNKLLIGKIEEAAVYESNLIVSRISRITVGTEEVARNVSYQALYYDKNSDLDFFLKQVLKSNNILEGIHVELLDYQKKCVHKFSAGQPGQFKYKSDSLNFNQLSSKLKSETKNLKSGFWSDPFYSKSDTTHINVTYKIPIYIPDTKEPAGMLTSVVSLSRISQLLSEMKISKNGYAFIIDKTGKYLTHHRSSWILKKNLFEKPSIVYQDQMDEIESKIKNGGRGAGYGISHHLNNQKSWFYFAPLNDSNWSVILVFPEKELFRDQNSIFQKILFVSGLGILILFFLNMLIFKKIIDPLVRVAHAIQRFSSPDGQKNKSRNEIKMLADSLENWQIKYGILVDQQTQTAIERLKYEKDLKSAHEIQFNIIPTSKPAFPDHPEIDLYAVLKPVESVGGDLYDYFFIDKYHLLIAIGDVSGKGIPASLFMAIASTLIKTHAKVLSAKEIVSRVNNELSDRNSNQYFVTLFIGIIDIRSGIMDYCNAAHNYPYLLHPDGAIYTISQSHGLPLGIYKGKTYKNNVIELQSGDLIILYTDGVINSRDDKKLHYGTERLEKNIQNLMNLTAEEATLSLLKSILLHEGEEKQADDITLMLFKFNGKRENQT